MIPPCSSAFLIKVIRIIVFASIFSGICCYEDFTLAQVIPDTTLGSESSVFVPNANLDGNSSDQIVGGAVRGTNLFHSFQEFNVEAGRGVYFITPDGIGNIISRVTGGSPSKILGTLGVSGSNANLFLINPNEIFFGPNARLNTKGSFVASTARSILFNDRNLFSATESQSGSLLTVSVPTGLQFEGNAGRITVQGDSQGLRSTSGELIETETGLRVLQDQTLALIGGDLAIEGGTLKTAGGRIELGSVADSSQVSLTPIDKGWLLGYEGIQNFGIIQLSQKASVDASGAGAGDVQVQAEQVKLTDGSLIESSTLQDKSGGSINVSASESVELIGRSTDKTSRSALVFQVFPDANGDGSNLTLKTRRLVVKDGAQISGATICRGNSGSMVIRASELVELTGTTPQSASGLFTGVFPGAEGSSGDITIETKQLNIKDGAQLFSGTQGSGDAGSIAVSAFDINVVGKSTFSFLSSSIGTLVVPGGTGKGGYITIETDRLNIRDGGVVSSATFGDGGPAGNIEVKASDLIELSGTSANGRFPSRLSTRSSGINNAGSLTITARQLSIRDGAEVNVSSTSSGNAGNLQISADSINLDRQAALRSETVSGQGNIFLRSQNLVLRRNSNITTNATSAANGGDIDINTKVIAALENSSITANAIEGQGGNIRIDARGIFFSPDSVLTASSELGINGTIQFNNLITNPVLGLIDLPEALVDNSNLIAQGCPANLSPKASKFVVTGRGGLPENPSDPLNRNTTWSDSRLMPIEKRVSHSEIDSPAKSAASSSPLIEATHWALNQRGEVTLIAATPETSTNIPWKALATCQ